MACCFIFVCTLHWSMKLSLLLYALRFLHSCPKGMIESPGRERRAKGWITNTQGGIKHGSKHAVTEKRDCVGASNTEATKGSTTFLCVPSTRDPYSPRTCTNFLSARVDGNRHTRFMVAAPGGWEHTSSNMFIRHKGDECHSRVSHCS